MEVEVRTNMAAQNIPHPRKKHREMKWCLTTSMIIANETLDDDGGVQKSSKF